MLDEEIRDGDVRPVVVFPAGEAMPLVLEDQVTNVDPVCAHARDDLVRLGLGNTRIGSALEDEERRGDLLCVGDRRTLTQLAGILVGIADHRGDGRGPVGRDRAREGFKVGGSADRHACGPQVG